MPGGILREIEPHAGSRKHFKCMAVKLIHMRRIARGVFTRLGARAGKARYADKIFRSGAQSLLLTAAVNDGGEAL